MSNTTEREARERLWNAQVALHKGNGHVGDLVIAWDAALDAFRDAVAARAREEGAREAREERDRYRRALELIAQPWLCIPDHLNVIIPGPHDPPEPIRVQDYYNHAPKVARKALGMLP